MAALIHMVNDLMVGKTLGAGGLTASSTANGYNKDNIRDPNLFSGWKANPSTVDEYVQFQLAGPMSTINKTHFGFALDSRKTLDRLEWKLQGATVSTGPYTDLASMFVSGGPNGYIDVAVGSFIAGSAWTYIRFVNTYPGSGTKDCQVLLHVGLVSNSASVIDFSSSKDGPGPGSRSGVTNVSVVRAASAAYLTNTVAVQQQEYEFTLRPGGDANYVKFFSLFGSGGAARCCFALLDDVLGFNSEFSGTDCCIRLSAQRWQSDKFYVGEQNIVIPFITEPYTL